MAKRRRPAPQPSLPAVPPAEWVRAETIAALRVLRERALTPVIVFAGGRRESELLAEAARVAFPEDAGGVAFHHGGVLPDERRRVERALASGALWLVSGTTTLAAGLDVPAKSVLVTGFGRFDGTAMTLFSPSEYRQLAGRAGRLGKDDAGSVVLLASPWHAFDEAFRKLSAPLVPITSAFRPKYGTALAWWTNGGETALARALAGTFAAYLRRVGTGKGATRGPAPHAPDADAGPDGPSLLQARALGRLLDTDGLVDDGGSLTARGRFVLHLGGGPEGRLLLRVIESGAAQALSPAARAALLAALAEGPSPGEDPAVMAALRGAYREQIALERNTGALLTPPLVEPGPRAPAPDSWRRAQAATDLLDRAQRAARQSGVASVLLEWDPLGQIGQKEP